MTLTLAEDGVVLEAGFQSAMSGVGRPEIGLVAAIFEDALRCAQMSSRSVTRAQCWEARQWIASDRSDWPFAFVNVCDLLGVDASAVRWRLRIVEGRSWTDPIGEEPFSSPAGSAPGSLSRRAGQGSRRRAVELPEG